MPRPRLIWTINIGQVMQLVALVVALGTMLVNQAKWQERTDQRLDFADIRANKYVPIVERLDSAVGLLAQRVDAQADSVRDMRNSQSDILTVVNKISLDVVELRTRVEQKGR